MNNTQKAEVARTLFLKTEKSQKEICEVVGWSEKTFIERKQKGKWEEMRDTRSLTKQQIISLLHNQTLKIVDAAKDENRLLSGREVDSIAKLASSIDKLEKKATLETFIEVFEDYNRWLMGVNMDFAQRNNHYQDLFIQSKITK
ncbi:MAG TPA: hypothetical protein VE978_13310 [Chitinophagales bacterium]|nr:hypothetical protein [Chitinophagales bacterium]